jgi:folate-dependent phosphoribosylglycinamide formyltransferase PurN
MVYFSKVLRSALICHAGDDLNRIGLAQWLASFTDLVGIVELHETSGRLLRRIQKEIERNGWLRFLDITAFRIYYRFALAAKDDAWITARVSELTTRYPALPPGLPVLKTHSANSSECETFLRQCRPDIVIARCKQLLKPQVFNIPTLGTYVMHPGVCPEYRNAHGCFWALANGDMNRVGMTLLRIDRGVDTGPVYGYFYPKLDEIAESHIVIQNRTVFDNLDQIQSKVQEIAVGTAVPLDTTGRKSHTWGQPWLSRYLAWKKAARKRSMHASHHSAVP